MKRNIDVIIAIALFLIVFLVYMKILIDCPLLPGIDGPYYAVQVSHIMKTGKLKYPDPPLTFYVMYLFTLVCNNVFLGVKITTSFMTALSIIPLFFLILHLTGSRIIAVSSSTIYSFSFYLIRMMSDFMKNSIGTLWLNLGLLILIEFMLHKLRERTFIPAYLVTLFLTGITHILDFCTLLAYSILLSFLWYLLSSDKKRGKMMLKSVVMVQISILVIFLSFVTLLTGGDLFKILSFIRDLTKSLTSNKVYIAFMFNPRIFVPVFMGVLLMFLSLVSKISEAIRTVILSNSIMIFIFNLLPLTPGWIMRLNLMSCIPLAILIGLLIHMISTKTERIVRTVLMLIPLLASISIIDTYRPRPSIPPIAYNELKEIITSMEDKRTVWLVPSVKIRYWVETITDNVITKPRPLPLYKYKVLLIIYKLHFRHMKPIRARLVYSSWFFEVYRLR